MDKLLQAIDMKEKLNSPPAKVPKVPSTSAAVAGEFSSAVPSTSTAAEAVASTSSATTEAVPSTSTAVTGEYLRSAWSTSSTAESVPSTSTAVVSGYSFDVMDFDGNPGAVGVRIRDKDGVTPYMVVTDDLDSVPDKVPIPIPDDLQTRCTFYIAKKKRFCKLNRLSGQHFCAEHLPVTESEMLSEFTAGATSKAENVLNRMPCPYDPNHTVAISKWNTHLKKCNSRPPTKEYYQPGINTISKGAVAIVTEDGKSYPDPLELDIFKMNQMQMLELIKKIIDFHLARVPIIPDRFGIHEHLSGEFVKSNVGDTALRHTAQIAAIAKIMDDSGMLKDSTCFIEFGSGRGGLSYGLAQIVKNKGLKNCKFVCVDRSSPRYKKDNRAKTSEFKDIIMERVKVNIEDLVVGKLPGIQSYENIVGIAKHLCGSGTDVALRSLVDEKSNSERAKVRGMVFATCCHHRTEYHNMMGNNLLVEDFSGGNFNALRQISAWATNGDYTSSYIQEYARVPEDILKFLMGLEKGRYPELRLKKTIGRLVKQIIDHCRVMHLKHVCANFGLEFELVNYVDFYTTLENVAILCHPKPPIMVLPEPAVSLTPEPTASLKPKSTVSLTPESVPEAPESVPEAPESDPGASESEPETPEPVSVTPEPEPRYTMFPLYNNNCSIS